MTKENFTNKWAYPYNINGAINPYFVADLESVIAHEIAKVKEVKLELNQIAEAYHNYKPIRYKKWEKFQWIKKHSEFEAKTENGAIFNVVSLNFTTQPEEWELYTEPTEQPEEAKPQPDFNPIEEAYERWEKIRMKEWAEGDWIQKYDEIKCISRNRLIQSFKLFSQKINTNPEKWELYTEPTEQPAPEMCESDAIDYILTNKLNWKKLGNNRMFAIGFARTGVSFRVSFVEYHHTLSGTREVIINNIDLSEWQPVDTSIKLTEQPAKPFDKDRFEAMFRAVYQTTKSSDFNLCVKFTKEILTELDAFYASKEGGNNE